MEPIQTLLPPIPEKLLNYIFYNCRKSSTANWDCEKVKLLHSQVCTSCKVHSCYNVESNGTVKDSYDRYQWGGIS